MNTQNKKLNAGTKIRRVMLAIFVLCFFASVALLSGGFGAGTGGEGAGIKLAGDIQVGKTTYSAVGGGIDGDPWLIGNALQLKDLANKVNGVAPYAGAVDTLSGSYIKLTADIDLSELPGYNVVPGWAPIGNYSTTSIYFAGSFDGGGFEVSNLYINITASVSTYAGLFGYIGSGGAVSNLGVSGSVAVVLSGGNSPYAYAGGIAGINFGGSVTDGHSAVVVNATSDSNAYAGGIAGASAGNISGSYNNGSVSATSTIVARVGGITGDGSGLSVISPHVSTIEFCYNTGSVSASGDGIKHAGGISGIMSDFAGDAGYSILRNSYNAGTVSATGGGNKFAGGIVAYIIGSVGNCYSTGTVSATGSDTATVGGIAGALGSATSSITGSYGAGTVSATGGSTVYAGGIAGRNDDAGAITTSYYNTGKFTSNAVGSGTQPSGYTAGLSAAAMAAGDTLTNSAKMSGLGTANFTKRANDTANGIVYYPELSVFYSSANETMREASKASVTTAVDMSTYDAAGEGTQGSPWLIYTAAQLKDLADRVNGTGTYSAALTLSGSYIKLTANISLSGYQSGTGWVPIGSYSSSAVTFNGSFDGGGFEVSNLYINITGATAAVYIGLFGYISTGGAVSNLGVSGSVSATTSGNYESFAGGITGYVIGGGITSCYNTGSVTVNGYFPCAGGIAGSTYSSITSCYNTGSVSGTTANGSRVSCGGITGSVGSNNDISYNYNTGTIIGTNTSSSGNTYVGGIAGSGYGSISYSYNTGSMSASSARATGGGSYAGGIAGHIGYYGGGAAASITSSYNTGSVSTTNSSNGISDAGGIAGIVMVSGSITSSYSAGTVSATGGGSTVYAGGIAGYDDGGTITNSYYSSSKFSGTAVGNNAATLPAAGLSTAAMTAADALTTMSGLGANFTKRANGNGVLYYPELAVFKNSTNPAIEVASRISVSITSAQYNPFYAIRYRLDGGTNNAANQDSYSKESAPITLFAPTRDDYTFGGWYTDAGLTAAVTGVAIPTNSTGERTFYAKWTATEYDITYNNVNGAANDNQATYTVESTAITLSALGVRTGYTFGGWYTTEDFSGDKVTSIAAGSTGNKEFWAKWTATEYDINYNNVNGAANGNPGTYTIEDAVTLSALGVRAGYTFGGWYTDEGLTTAVTGVAIAHGSTGNKEFWAKWTANAVGGDGTTTDLGDITVPALAVLDAVLLLSAIIMVRRAIREDKAAAKALISHGYGQGAAPYGNMYGAPNMRGAPYGRQPNPYGGAAQSPYGRPNPYMQQQNPYMQASNPYAPRQNMPQPNMHQNMPPPYGRAAAPSPYGQQPNPYNFKR